MTEAGTLRVAMVCPYSLARPGGVQGQARGLARALRAQGHAVVVLAPDDRPEAGRGDPDTIAVGRSVGVRANGSVAPVCLSPVAAWRTRRLLAAGGFDVVHLHEPFAPLVGYGCLLGPPAALVATFHRAGASPGYQALRPLAQRVAGRLDVTCAVSDAARQTAEAALGIKSEVLFNGIELDRFSGSTTSGHTVLFVGRHEERKGLAILLNAFEAVDEPAELWVAGDGPETEALRRRFPDSARRRWLGILSDAALADRLARADVLCAPSLGGESFGVVLLEAMAARCAVVASDLPGYAAAAAGHAELVAPGDAGALARGLRTALRGAAGGSERSSPTALAAAAAHAAQWSMEGLAAAYDERYRLAVHRHRRPPGRRAGR
jgi:phosphatidylinositol alpha-mannosyltransferase